VTLPQVHRWRKRLGKCPYYRDIDVYEDGDDATGSIGVGCTYNEKHGPYVRCPVWDRFGGCPVLNFTWEYGRIPTKKEAEEYYEAEAEWETEMWKEWDPWGFRDPYEPEYEGEEL